MTNRGNFSAPVRQTIAVRAAYFCSNPRRLKLPAGPHSDFNKALTTRHTAHIHAAARASLVTMQIKQTWSVKQSAKRGDGCSLARTPLCPIFPVTGKNTGNFPNFSRLIRLHLQKTRTGTCFPPHSVKLEQFRNRERAGNEQAVNREFSTEISDSNRSRDSNHRLGMTEIPTAVLATTVTLAAAEVAAWRRLKATVKQ
jgi:hypothetical protein